MSESPEATFRSLAALEDDWDGYGARRTHVHAIELARRLIHALSESPAVVPTSKGGVQLEWHRGGVDIEICVSPEGDMEPFIEVITRPEPTHD